MTQPRIEIVGAGTVGQATGAALAEKGYAVHYVDTDPEKRRQVSGNGRRAYEPSHGEPFDVAFLCVPTPTRDGRFDVTALRDASAALGARLKRFDHSPLVVVKSTALPGVTRGEVIPTIEQHSGKAVGRGFGVCVSPEFLRERHARDDAAHPRAVVIGADDAGTGKALEQLYLPFDAPILHTSIESAEFQKYAHNLYNAVKISFFNELRALAGQTGVDAQAAFDMAGLTCEGLWNAGYGLQDRGPFDGKCLPKDVEAFLGWAEDIGAETPVLRAAVDLNRRLIERRDEGG